MATIQQQVFEALLDGSSRVTRRAEIYEADGTTIFADSDNTPRIIGGNVSVDNSRDERRSLDITFDNSDGVLKHDPDGFWYDKIIKVFRGTEWDSSKAQPNIAIIASPDNNVRTGLQLLGYDSVTAYTPQYSGDLMGWDVIIADGGTSAITAANYAFLTDAFNAGKPVLTISDEADSTHPLIATTVNKTDAAAWAMTPVTTDSPLNGRWAAFTSSGTTTGKVISAVTTGAKPAATYVWSTVTYFVAVTMVNSQGGKWVHLQPPFVLNSPGYSQLLNASMEWLFPRSSSASWETQIGEFMIDRITEPRFPRTIQVTGRDYSKKLLKSKFSQALTFADGTSVDVVIQAIAANGGITKFNLNSENASLFGDMSFDRTTERWAAIKGIADAAAIEVYFDPRGYLTTRPMQDPSLSPSTLLLTTGSEYGNLVNYTKSSNDSRLYNRVIVTSENQDAVADSTYGLQAIAENTQPGSPTSIDRIGERDYFYTSSFFTSLEQMQRYADKLLKIVALEEYSLDFDVVPFYWSEAGDIIEFSDPHAGVDEPTRFLMDSFNIPLALGTMSGTAKRVTIVGQAT